uniref:Uncharacterized protein n=2 Tax=Kalanchoe fedtschenkoi TaxID=63787 RepID=A0A7N0V6P5_KALFE
MNEKMQTIAKRLKPSAIAPIASISSLKSPYTLNDRHFGGEHPRFASTTTLSTTGVGHLVRKGTGGRSSVRWSKWTYGNW